MQPTMGSARGISPITASMSTHVAFDRSRPDFAIGIATQANSKAMVPIELAPTTCVTPDRARNAMEAHDFGTPKIATERVNRRSRQPRLKRGIGSHHRNSKCGFRFPPPLPQLRACALSVSEETATNVGRSLPRLSELADLPEGTYVAAALHLDARDLRETDVTCRTLRVLNQSRFGPWHALGVRAFRGIELEKLGVFDVADAPPRCNKHGRMDWKVRYWHFHQKLPTFQLPFIGQEIRQVQKQDQVAYCCCMLRKDLLCMGSDIGIYIEFEVIANVDNLSLALVDFEASGNGCVTFSPDTGVVFREKKVQEAPRKVAGAYFQPLAATIPSSRFEGSLGLYFYAGHLAFFRRCASDVAEQESRRWETTGFVTDLSWAEGQCLVPCLAFRKEGQYRVKIVAVDSAPPLRLGNAPQTYDEANWRGLDWEAPEL